MPTQKQAVEKQYKLWFKKKNWEAFPYQLEVLDRYLDGYNGLLNAPTGSGKTYSLWLPIMLNSVYGGKKQSKGLKVLWISPVRALAQDLKIALEEACKVLGIDWSIGIRTGDTETAERTKQRNKPPECLITTPESLQLLLCSKGYEQLFSGLEAVVIDEWHELLGSKRGTQTELGLARVRTIKPEVRVWGISATIGNLQQGLEVLTPGVKPENRVIVKANIDKDIKIVSLLPDVADDMPYSGHLGINLIEKTLPVIEASTATLVFTNTRAQCEIWFQKYLELKPEWAGLIALHHGSMDQDQRRFVESALKNGLLKMVVCTSSLDLGIDFRPVETIIQIGGPKGVARFLQRAGRSGHRPGALSCIYFVPAHSLELLEAAALRKAIAEARIESKIPIPSPYDVLIQYLVTLAVAEGFTEEAVYQEIKGTYSYKNISPKVFKEILDFLTKGGDTLQAYEEFFRIKQTDDGVYRIKNRRLAMQHRMGIGTILSSNVVAVKYMSGTRLGTVEEYFISQLKPGDVFVFAGKSLEFVQLKEMNAFVKKSTKKKPNIPSWQGGRMPLSSQLAEGVRKVLTEVQREEIRDPEVEFILPILTKQAELSHLPADNEFLIEYHKTREGEHIFFYTFEGRFVNEGLGSLLAYRVGQTMPATFSIGATDYGFELLTDQPLDVEYLLSLDLFNKENLLKDIETGMNTIQLAGRKFREIAQIAGLIFNGYPGKEQKLRHIQASSKMFFDAFRNYEPDNLLYRQAIEEVLNDQLEFDRMNAALDAISKKKFILRKPEHLTPFCFPILAERIRNKLTTEKLEDKLSRILAEMAK